MPLDAHVQDRVSDQLLIELTNQGNPAATTINATVLGAAVTDTEGEFLIDVGIPYDDADAAHVQAAVMGVVWFLHSYTGITGRNAEAMQERWNKAKIRLAQTRGSEKRLLPQGTPEQEGPREFTEAAFGSFIPRMPTDCDDEDTIGDRLDYC